MNFTTKYSVKKANCIILHIFSCYAHNAPKQKNHNTKYCFIVDTDVVHFYKIEQTNGNEKFKLGAQQ